MSDLIDRLRRYEFDCLGTLLLRRHWQGGGSFSDPDSVHPSKPLDFKASLQQCRIQRKDIVCNVDILLMRPKAKDLEERERKLEVG
jgi:hypothetical protein